MLIKIAALLLIAVTVLAMFGKLRPKMDRPLVQNAVKCPRCGVFLIGNGSHDCKGKA